MVFWCSCDSQRAQLVDCLPSVNSECFETLEQHFPPCMHIIAAKIVLEQVDCINDISPSIDFAVHTYASLDLYGEWEVGY